VKQTHIQVAKLNYPVNTSRFSKDLFYDNTYR